jgi:hypothetical protein
MVSMLCPVPWGFEADKTTRKVPLCVGIPEMIPVEVLICSPLGSPHAAKFVGEFVAVMRYW